MPAITTEATTLNSSLPRGFDRLVGSNVAAQWVGGHWSASACLGLAFAGFGLQVGIIVWSQVRRLAHLPVPAG